MEVMKATTARAKTIEAIEAKRRHMIDMIDARITASVAAGKFECNFLVDSPAIQDGLFDYLTSLGYAVKFMPHVRNGEKYYDSDNRIINVSWEEAVQ